MLRHPLVATGNVVASVAVTEMSSIDFHDDSVIAVTGGSIFETGFDDGWGQGLINCSDRARVKLDGTSIIGVQDDSTPIRTFGQCQLELRGTSAHVGHFTAFGAQYFYVADASQVVVKSGVFSSRVGYAGAESQDHGGARLVLAKDISTLRIDGGAFNYSGEGAGHGDFTGDVLSVVEVEDGSQAEINGGTFSLQSSMMYVGNTFDPHFVLAKDDARVTIRGGSYSGKIELAPNEPANNVHVHDLAARDTAQIVVVGSEFNYPLGAIEDIEGVLSGVLLDGSSFTWTFQRDATASVVLVPEPTTALSALIA
ncbi:MAG: hypothetical protein KDB23_32785, partial [Planctomycetales bacterium]|nr:hypothetical protein [Planctomycetales bacterium]